ncbi:hypothetical protein GLOIN_2v1872452 [Rhizophagus irregularis DAOM 181602=DAOM 197198]|nr:hypothetical protein GLOIN_2v1872452 [Rhizophagus irregularis DAOM 181602=DAOM 197198]
MVILNNECCNYFDLSFELIQQNPYFICNIKNFKLCFDENVAKITKFYPFLKFLHSNCNSISSLNINIKLFFYNNNNSDVGITLLSEEHLPKIINSQKNLRKISFEGCINFPLYHSLLSLKNSNCSNTLNTIIFHHINFKDITNILIEVFEQLNVLESIHIIYCSLDSDFVEKIINVTKPFKLKSLFISGNLQIEPIESLLQKSGGYLENFGSGSESNQLFKLIMKYCPKIKYFDLFDLDNCHDNITTAFNLIKNIENTLNYLSIESVDIEFNQMFIKYRVTTAWALNYKERFSLILWSIWKLPDTQNWKKSEEIRHKFDDLTRPEQPYQVTNPPGKCSMRKIDMWFCDFKLYILNL